MGRIKKNYNFPISQVEHLLTSVHPPLSSSKLWTLAKLSRHLDIPRASLREYLSVFFGSRLLYIRGRHGGITLIPV